MKHIYTEEGGFQRMEAPYGSLVTVVAGDESSHEMLSDQVNMTIDFNDNFLESLFTVLQDKYENVGLLVKIEVGEEHRGSGKGNSLMNDFSNDVSAKTDVDILFARINNKQKEGFKLKEFYQKHGFDPVWISEGNMLMVNKGKGPEILKQIFPNRSYDNDMSL